MLDLLGTVSSKAQKFSLSLEGGGAIESVILPMNHYSTLCISSQLGCARGCVFCETGRMGFIRNLSTEEILSQIYYARNELGVDDIQNIVFMGMGEPFDNFDAVIEAVDAISNQQGINIPKRRISISTAGHARGIERLQKLCEEKPHAHYHTLHLSLSLHSANNGVRSDLMPINKLYPLEELREVLLKGPYSQRKDGLYIEYILFPGVNDSPDDLNSIFNFLSGMVAKINLATYNEGYYKGEIPLTKAELEQLDFFKTSFIAKGYPSWVRKSRGEELMAACGQLKTETVDEAKL